MSIEQRIYGLLNKDLNPSRIEILNESHKHAHHASSPGTGESHFSIIIVSDKFENQSKVQRHRLIYNCLQQLMNNPIHALSIKAYTNFEFKTLSQVE